MTYLRKLPIDEVKVDYDLIGHVLTDPRAEAIVRAVIDLAHALNVTTVAEGVENAEMAAWLRDRGCEVAQGILYSPPDRGFGNDGTCWRRRRPLNEPPLFSGMPN